MTMSESAIGRLQAIVGFSKAMEILLIGEPIKCDEAKRLNICNRVAPCGTCERIFFINIRYFILY